MTEDGRLSSTPQLSVKLAGVGFRSPIGLAPIGGGSHFGRPDVDPDREHEICVRFLLEHVRAGSNCIYLNFSYVSPATFAKLAGGEPLQAATDATSGQIDATKAPGERFMRAATPVSPYGVEGLYSTVAPGPSVPVMEREAARLRAQTRLMEGLRRERPAGVPIIAGAIGCGGLPDAYVEQARIAEGLGADLVELNFHCPLQAGGRGGVYNALWRRFPPYSQGGLMIEHPDEMQEIVREVVRAVGVPVGVKFSAEVGFPRIVGLAGRVKDAGAKYISVGGAAVGIAPPDIYRRGRPSWPMVDGSPFCLTSGSWMRRVCYRDVAAVARFVPGLDIIASGGLVTPQHCIEAMMLGATLAQLCTGVLEQGRSLLARTDAFLRSFLADQGYSGAEELVGLGQPYIEYAEDIDVMGGRVMSIVDDAACTRCDRCLDGLCIAIGREDGRIVVDRDRCTGCGACTIVCREDAFRLVHRNADGWGGGV